MLKPRLQLFSHHFITVCFWEWGLRDHLMRLAGSRWLLRLGHGGFHSFTVSLDLLKNAYWLTSELRKKKIHDAPLALFLVNTEKATEKKGEWVGTWEFNPEELQMDGCYSRRLNGIGHCLGFSRKLGAKAGKALPQCTESGRGSRERLPGRSGVALSSKIKPSRKHFRVKDVYVNIAPPSTH